jgi:tRNA nucleotidyltransferase (CCA-adding enzyme)
LKRIKELATKAHELELQENAPKPILLGRHLLNLGYAPSPQFKSILATAFEAQLDGAFANERSGITWLQKHLRNHPLN